MRCSVAELAERAANPELCNQTPFGISAGAVWDSIYRTQGSQKLRCGMAFLKFKKSLVALLLLSPSLWIFLAPSANAGDAKSWLANARSSLDVSARFIHSDNQFSDLYAVGFDYFNVFSTDRGDVGTLIFQPFLVRSDFDQTVAGFSTEQKDTGLKWRISNFNYTGIGRGRFNVRVGHFELPFGLEQIVQTNGTLNQTNAFANTGLKTDWGISLNGELPALEYELGFMRGGGNRLRTDANGYFVGRVGLPRYRSWWLGVSGVTGELEFNDALVNLKGVALDAGIRLPNGLHLMTEYTVQETNSVSTSHVFSELGYTNRNEALITYLQWRVGDAQNAFGASTSPKASLGMRFEPTRRWSASAEIQQLSGSAGGSQAYVMQLRFRS